MGTQLPQLAEQLSLALQTLNSNTSREQKQQASSFLEGFQKSVLLPYFDYYFLYIMANAKPFASRLNRVLSYLVSFKEVQQLASM